MFLYTRITVLLIGCCSLLCAMEEKSIIQHNSTGSFIPLEQTYNESGFQPSKTAMKKLKRQQRRERKYAKRNQKQESTPQQSFNQFIRNREKIITPCADEIVQKSNPLVSDTTQVLSNADQTSSPLLAQEKDTTQKTTTSDEQRKNATWAAWFASLFESAKS